MDSSPGPDGFGFGFFRHCWDLVKIDLGDAVGEFFQGVPLSKFYTSSFIILILKLLSPSSFDNFRSISLCSMVYKICSKVVVGRSMSVLNRVISLEQCAFLP